MYEWSLFGRNEGDKLYHFLLKTSIQFTNNTIQEPYNIIVELNDHADFLLFSKECNKVGVKLEYLEDIKKCRLSHKHYTQLRFGKFINVNKDHDNE